MAGILSTHEVAGAKHGDTYLSQDRESVPHRPSPSHLAEPANERRASFNDGCESKLATAMLGLAS